MPLVIISLSHVFSESMKILDPMSRYLEKLIDALPEITAQALNSTIHPVTAQDVEVWPQVLHILARTKFHISIDIFTASDSERSLNCFKRANQIKCQLISTEQLLPAQTNFCIDIHLDIEAFAVGRSS